MTTTTSAPAAPLTGGVRRIVLDGAGVPLSALLAEPEPGPFGEPAAPRATVVALHGGGMSAGYFHGQAQPGLSLLTLGARLGFTVLSLDRPGYGESTTRLPHGQTLKEQSDTLRAALADYSTRYATGAGLFLLAHSYGGKLALTAAADDSGDAGAPLLGLDVSGCGQEYAVGPDDLPGSRGHGHWTRNWGALRFYPPGTFTASGALVAPMPERERAEALRWPEMFPDVAARVRVPVRLTFAEYESWWRHDEAALARLTGRFTAAPRLLVERLPDAGHNISLGLTARTYHLRALAFLEECLATLRPEV